MSRGDVQMPKSAQHWRTPPESNRTNIAGLAMHLNLPQSWLKTEAKEGRIPCLIIGRRTLFNRRAVKEALAARAATPMILVHHHEIIRELTYICKVAKAEIERLYAGQPEPNLQESHAYILLKQVTEENHNE